MPTVIMPSSASAAGEAFELLASRYLCDVVGLEHLATPFYMHLARGRWVQFDGLFARPDGRRLVLEAKFYTEPADLATPGIAARIAFAAEAGVNGVIFCARAGFGRDLMRARTPVEKAFLSWRAMRRGLGDWGKGALTAALDPVFRQRRGFTAMSGASLVTSGFEEVVTADGFLLVPVEVERWLRRLPAAPCDVSIWSPPRKAPTGAHLDTLSAWTVEDSLHGYAPTSPKLLETALAALTEGPLDMMSAWKAFWRLGYRGRRGGIKNALDNLRLIGLAEKFRTGKGLYYGPVPGRASRGDDAIPDALEKWPALTYLRAFRGVGGDKYAISERLSRGFLHLFPYARSLYNPAKVAGLLALERYFTPAASTTSPS